MIENNGTPMTGGRPESANGVHFHGWDAVKCKRCTLSALGERECVNGVYFQRGSFGRVGGQKVETVYTFKVGTQ